MLMTVDVAESGNGDTGKWPFAQRTSDVQAGLCSPDIVSPDTVHSISIDVHKSLLVGDPAALFIEFVLLKSRRRAQNASLLLT